MLLRTLTTSNREPALIFGNMVWMPLALALASDEKDAQIYLNELFMNASMKALSELGYSIKHKTITHTPTFGTTTIHKIIYLQGNECSPAYLEKHIEGKYECRLFVVVKEPKLIEDTPKWIDKNNTYHWTHRNGGPAAAVSVRLGIPDDSSSKGRYTHFHNDDFQKQLSHYLPAWVYIYLAPISERIYPVILNGGRELYFVEPQS